MPFFVNPPIYEWLPPWLPEWLFPGFPDPFNWFPEFQWPDPLDWIWPLDPLWPSYWPSLADFNPISMPEPVVWQPFTFW